MDGEERPPLRFFRSPTSAASPDVARVWLDCCLPEVAEMNDILWALDTWARLNCHIEMRHHRTHGSELPYLFWRSPSGVRHECFADTFSRWFLCGCVAAEAPPPPSNPQVTIVPLQLESLSEEEEELLNGLSSEESEEVDKKLDEIRIHSLGEPEPLSIDDIAHFNLEMFLSSITE